MIPIKSAELTAIDVAGLFLQAKRVSSTDSLIATKGVSSTMLASLFLESWTTETIIKGTFRPSGPVIPLAAEIEFIARGSLGPCFIND